MSVEFVNSLNDQPENQNNRDDFEVGSYYAICMRHYVKVGDGWRSRLTVTTRKNSHTGEEEPNIMRNRKDAVSKVNTMQDNHDRKRKEQGKKRNVLYGVYQLVRVED